MDDNDSKDGKSNKRGRPVMYTDSTRKKRRAEQEKDRRKNIVNIGRQKDRWDELRMKTGHVTNESFASQLMDRFEHFCASTPGGTQYMSTALSSLSSVDSSASIGVAGVCKLPSSNEEIEATDSGPTPTLNLKGKFGKKMLISEKEEPAINQSSSFIHPDNLELSISIAHDESHIYEDPDDPDYICSEPEVAIIQPGIDMNSLPEISPMDHVFGGVEECEDDGGEEETMIDQSSFHYVASSNDIHQSSSIAYTTCLLALANMSVPKCCTSRKCGKPCSWDVKLQGTAITLMRVCNDGHTSFRWLSQPFIKGKRVLMGDFRLSAAITLSGNNYRKIALLHRFAQIGMISASSFHRLSGHAIHPGVINYWEVRRLSKLEHFKGRDVILAGDGRMDSPGWSAKYCTYTMIEYDSKEILDMVFVDKRMVEGKSPNMEALGFLKALNNIIAAGINVVEVVTDAHISITATMRKHYPNIKHSHDMWHGGKNLGKKIASVASEKKNAALKPWISDIANHFWHCCKTCGGNSDILQKKWIGLVPHIVDKHSWALGSCEHAPLAEEDRTKEWLVPGSDPHKAVSNIVFEARRMKSLHYFSNFRTTSELEIFHNHILMYNSKRFAYGYQGYKARCLLAGIDYNEHIDRPLLRNKKGDIVMNRMYSKSAKHWHAVPCKVPKKYKYLGEILDCICDAMMKVNLSSSIPLQEDDPRHIKPTIAPKTPPPTQELVEKRRSRFEKE